LLYPSIITNANADNFAFKTDFVDKHLKIEKIEYGKVKKHVNEYQYKIEILDEAENSSKNGNIEWKGKRQKWLLNKDNSILIFKIENDSWIAQDIHGSKVNPIDEIS
jgi:hypothetical protein